jgi:hypothetical protein
MPVLFSVAIIRTPASVMPESPTWHGSCALSAHLFQGDKQYSSGEPFPDKR